MLIYAVDANQSVKLNIFWVNAFLRIMISHPDAATPYQVYTAFQKAVEIYPSCSIYLMPMGFIYFTVNQYCDCVEALARSI